MTRYEVCTKLKGEGFHVEVKDSVLMLLDPEQIAAFLRRLSELGYRQSYGYLYNSEVPVEEEIA